MNYTGPQCFEGLVQNCFSLARPHLTRTDSPKVMIGVNEKNGMDFDVVDEWAEMLSITKNPKQREAILADLERACANINLVPGNAGAYIHFLDLLVLSGSYCAKLLFFSSQGKYCESMLPLLVQWNMGESVPFREMQEYTNEYVRLGFSLPRIHELMQPYINTINNLGITAYQATVLDAVRLAMIANNPAVKKAPTTESLYEYAVQHGIASLVTLAIDSINRSYENKENVFKRTSF